MGVGQERLWVLCGRHIVWYVGARSHRRYKDAKVLVMLWSPIGELARSAVAQLTERTEEIRYTLAFVTTSTSACTTAGVSQTREQMDALQFMCETAPCRIIGTVPTEQYVQYNPVQCLSSMTHCLHPYNATIFNNKTRNFSYKEGVD